VYKGCMQPKVGHMQKENKLIQRKKV